MKTMISAVCLTKNEEKNIKECLKTLEWCDEIVIIDDYSKDQTIKLIEQIGSIGQKTKIFQRHLNNDFTAQRNFGLEKAKGEWVLFVDADERVTPKLAREIGGIGEFEGIEGFFIRRRDFLFGKWLGHGETGNIKLVRLAKKNKGKWIRPVHETWQINGRIGELTNPLLHYPHQAIGEFLGDINYYTNLNARVFYDQKIHSSWWQIIFYPSAKFVNNYFFKLGFLDGIPGLLSAIFMSFHSFLTRAKLWFLWQKNEQ